MGGMTTRFFRFRPGVSRGLNKPAIGNPFLSPFEDQIISFGFPDTKIHTSKDGLTILAQELAQAFEREVLPLIRRLPERSLCLFFADHGFRENPQFEPHDKYAAARYTHGGNSPWEVLCPWTAYFKIK